MEGQQRRLVREEAVLWRKGWQGDDDNDDDNDGGRGDRVFAIVVVYSDPDCRASPLDGIGTGTEATIKSRRRRRSGERGGRRDLALPSG